MSFSISDAPPPYSLAPSAPAALEPASRWTTVKTQKLALYLFSAISLSCAIAFGALAIAGAIAPGWGCLAIPLGILSVGGVYLGRSLLDYEDPKELFLMRQEARDTSFQDLYKKHGAANLRKYIASHSNDGGPSMNDLRAQCRQALQSMLFRDVVKTFDVDSLVHHSFIERTLACTMQKLKNQSQRIERTYAAAVRAADFAYPGRTQRLQRQAREVELQAYQVNHLARDDSERRRTADAAIAVGGLALQVGAAYAGQQEQEQYDATIIRAQQARNTAWEALEQQYANLR